MIRQRRRLLAGVLVALTLTGAVAACSSEASTPTPEAQASSSTVAAQPLRIVVSNDDGIASPGLDQLVTALAELPDVDITVVAPAENQSGSSDKTTPGGVTYAAGVTASGVEGTAVNGFPADAVNVALDELGLDPDLVVSGVNAGQNVGPLASLSGTVGVARTAVRAGIPALALSAGLTYDAGQYAVAIDDALAWITTNRDQLVDRTLPAEVVSINVPACPLSSMGDVVDVALATTLPEGLDVFVSACTPTGEVPTDDVTALTGGWATRTRVPTELPPFGG